MKILRYRPYDKQPGPLQGFFNIQLPSGLVLNDLKLMKHEEKGFWLGYPGREYTGEDGKAQYWDYINFKDTDTRQRFADLVIAALKAQGHLDQQQPADDSDHLPF